MTILAHPTLFDTPPAVIDDFRGTAARRTDPETSQRAADASQATAPVVRDRVLRILAYRWRWMTGNDINTEYQARWPKSAHWDSPRKRAGELVDAGLLERVDGNYHMTERGLKELTD